MLNSVSIHLDESLDYRYSKSMTNTETFQGGSVFKSSWPSRGKWEMQATTTSGESRFAWFSTQAQAQRHLSFLLSL